MHLIIGFLTALATLLFALDRLGIDLGWFNPWAWKRRRAWLKQATGNPAYGLDRPIDAMSLIATAAAKIDGDLSIEEKSSLKTLFQDTFNQSEKDAAQLLGSSVYLLGPGDDVFPFPERVLNRSLDSFSDAQRKSSMELLSEVINIGGGPTELQEQFYEKVGKVLGPETNKDQW